MNLYLIAHIALTVALLAGIAAALLTWVDGLRANHDRAERKAVAAADREVSTRPHLRFPSPLPTINKGTSK